ncbi:unnamed protein product [Durusdinium trenchii]|uniref:Uncharacterized protein n=1 Tax=Durusdinium trenchii TaxID=1381693 RepID=A0ABP0QMM8_9DINO
MMALSYEGLAGWRSLSSISAEAHHRELEFVRCDCSIICMVARASLTFGTLMAGLQMSMVCYASFVSSRNVLQALRTSLCLCQPFLGGFLVAFSSFASSKQPSLSQNAATPRDEVFS